MTLRKEFFLQSKPTRSMFAGSKAFHRKPDKYLHINIPTAQLQSSTIGIKGSGFSMTLPKGQTMHRNCVECVDLPKKYFKCPYCLISTTILRRGSTDSKVPHGFHAELHIPVYGCRKLDLC